MPVEIVVPNEAEPGTHVSVKLYFSGDYVGRAVQATGYWYEGTGLTAYQKVFDKKGHPLGTRSGTVSGDGLTLDFGSVKMPEVGFTVGFHVTVSGNQFFIYDKVKPKAEEPQPPSPPGPEPPEPQPSISIQDALMAELKRWYKKTVNVPRVIGTYDWSYDVTQTVIKSRLIEGVERAYLYGWYKINNYSYVGPNRPSPRSDVGKVTEWINGTETALLNIDRQAYKLANGNYGWYLVSVPCRLMVIKSEQPGPEPQPQPSAEDKSSDALKLLGLGALALIILKSRG